MSADALLPVLRRYWGYDTFRPLQREAMDAILARRDSLVVLPTGGGKSLCFQAPALAGDGLAIVVSPLIALMKDQVDTLVGNGAAAACYHSALDPEARQRIVAGLGAGFRRSAARTVDQELQALAVLVQPVLAGGQVDRRGRGAVGEQRVEAQASAQIVELGGGQSRIERDGDGMSERRHKRARQRTAARQHDPDASLAPDPRLPQRPFHGSAARGQGRVGERR